MNGGESTIEEGPLDLDLRLGEAAPPLQLPDAPEDLPRAGRGDIDLNRSPPGTPEEGTTSAEGGPSSIPPAMWVDPKVHAWKSRPDAPLQVTPEWAERHIHRSGGYARVFAEKDFRVISEPPRGKGQLVESYDSIYVVFRDKTMARAQDFVASGIPTARDGEHHIHWPENPRYRVPSTFSEILFEFRP